MQTRSPASTFVSALTRRPVAEATANPHEGDPLAVTVTVGPETAETAETAEMDAA